MSIVEHEIIERGLAKKLRKHRGLAVRVLAGKPTPGDVVDEVQRAVKNRNDSLIEQ